MITLLVAALLSGQDYNDPANHCANPSNGLDVSACMTMLLTAETERMNRYLATATAALDGRMSESGETLASSLTQSQTRWEAYADATCGVVREAAGFLEQDCRSELTQQRTHHLWQYFLTQSDGPALLNEPEPFTVEDADAPASEPGD